MKLARGTKLVIVPMFWAAILATTGTAEAVTIYVDQGGVHRGSMSTTDWRSATVKDLSCDGRGAYGEYYRGANYGQTYAGGGCGTSAGTGSSSSLISRMRVCLDISGSPDPCSNYVYR